jgi:hypothetical protein
MAYQINGLKHTEAGVDELEVLAGTFETKELALQYVIDNLKITTLSEDKDVIVLDNGTEEYHYFEIITAVE